MTTKPIAEMNRAIAEYMGGVYYTPVGKDKPDINQMMLNGWGFLVDDLGVGGFQYHAKYDIWLMPVAKKVYADLTKWGNVEDGVEYNKTFNALNGACWGDISVLHKATYEAIILIKQLKG